MQALSSSCISKLGQIGRVKHNFDQPTLATTSSGYHYNKEWGIGERNGGTGNGEY